MHVWVDEWVLECPSSHVSMNQCSDRACHAGQVAGLPHRLEGACVQRGLLAVEVELVLVARHAIQRAEEAGGAGAVHLHNLRGGDEGEGGRGGVRWERLGVGYCYASQSIGLFRVTKFGEEAE